MPGGRHTDASSIAIAVATGLGAGFSPVAPGTAGTLVAVPLGWSMLSGSPLTQVVAVVAAAAVAVWAADAAAPHFGLKDPGQIVVDEIAGYLVAVALLPGTWTTLGAAFVLFRLFDVTKPPPCRQAERLAGGLGIVADDLLAGLYANLALRALAGLGVLSLLFRVALAFRSPVA